MSKYRRDRSAGSTYFFTVNTSQRGPTGPLVANIRLLKSVLRKVVKAHPVVIEAMVVLPDHIHCLWVMPKDDSDYSKRWLLIKSGFSRSMPIDAEIRSQSRLKRGERGIWQRRFWEHRIRDDTDYRNHLDYIHFNPVKHGYCQKVIQWPYSNFHKFVRLGVYSTDWGVDPDMSDGTGEIE